MHRRVGDLAKALFLRVLGIATAKRHVALQRLAVIGQRFEHLLLLDLARGRIGHLAQIVFMRLGYYG